MKRLALLLTGLAFLSISCGEGGERKGGLEKRGDLIDRTRRIGRAGSRAVERDNKTMEEMAGKVRR